MSRTDRSHTSSVRPATVTRSFLPEVQALRAVAVLLVVVYHFSPRTLPGGYVGVDVFFVISGFLISGHMLREVERTGRLSLTHFWAARARRILPAALVTILATLVGTRLFLPYPDWDRVVEQSLASILYVQNWVLAAESVDYLAADNIATPVQHFWSLAVEEQFYLLWPFVVVLAALLSRRVRALATRRRLVVLLLFSALTLASFGYGVARVAAGDAAAYFVTTTRLWELGVGGMLAVVLRYTDRHVRARTALALAGLAAIGYGAVTLDPAEHAFPGLNALFPVLGAAAVIAAGRTSAPLTRVIELRPVRWTGDVSYSLYLWHFPVITFFLGATQREPSTAEVLALMALAFVLAAASYYGVEQPVRRHDGLRLRDRRSLVLGLAAMAVAGLATQPLALAADHERDERAAVVARMKAGGVEGAAAMTPEADRFFVDGVKVVVPDPGQATQDAGRHGCLAKPSARTTPRCDLGDPDGDRLVALVGDSHARMMASALDELGREHGWRVASWTHASCPFSTEVRGTARPKREACQQANAQVMAELLALRPDAVVTANLDSADFVDAGTGRDPGVQGYADVWSRLERAGIPVVALRGTPVPDPDVLVPSCVAARMPDVADCGTPRAQALRSDVVEQAAALVPGTTVVDLTDRFCGERTCPAVVGNTLVYRDATHVTDTFVRSLVPYIEEQLPAGLTGS